MENTDILVFTSVIVVLFLVFIIATVREFQIMGTTKLVEKEDNGPRAEMMRFIGKIFTDESLDADKKITFMNAIKPFIDNLPGSEEIK